ncbi:branched-chain amino acid ABC transporter ATP-binding protein/permease [Achromobacter ruhlandii]|uniref:branched-chain amino acid ABC transporter ATP-binding protein/permease n=2 Tax=Achromobacter ruhlandii TaxID=72557 RepID=UPI0021F16AEB|nr:branched-chain amino acid ABC transporter ATP-binding protein/permease [Achromobacter ruhlandii]MCV6798410.1 branched-chain amino acid ABC transporter ATP-binding protein/permease [Achromobacter ruhlandii]MCV6805380.1 branched-chain amino acid ABC transporter ATP-binding protein/permease [Achromobacter ruhlandii]MCV6810125.1 branched-chain amino acid ABC transporter ATP-binding protein/permease [Achromobacter ruhlandii]MCV6819078.1 branched-chain amino acid ABC transporter ATP-binding protei
MTDSSLAQPALATRADPRRAARGRDLLWLAIACLALTVAGPWLFDTYLLNVLIKALFFAVAAVTVDILWGYTGYLTFGQSAFFGVGAYAAGLAFTHYGFSPGIALAAALVAVGAAMLLALATGWLSFYRGASPFFATVISLVLPIVLTQVVLSGGTYTGSSSGLTGYDTFDLSLEAWYVIAAGGLSIVALLAWVAVRSDGGRILAALRDNEGRCSYLGLNTAHWRIALLVVCGAVASLAGFGYGAFSGVVAPELTGFVFGTELIIWVALGGRGTVWGPVLGAVLINVAGSYLSGNMPFLYQLVLGVTFILVILLLPRGLLPLLLAPWRRRRPAPVPELVARGPAGGAASGGASGRGGAAGQGGTPGQGAAEGGLVLAGVAKRFGSLKVLEGIDLRARGGELLGLIGPNGAGKTTLMRCIADGAERSDGTVELCGHAVKRDGPEQCVRYGLGRKFQNANIFDTLTVAESLRIATTLRERPSWRRRAPDLALPAYALEVLRMTGLDRQLDRVARDLSHGQQQALELAMVLALEPRVVLLDEPTAGLSKDERARIGQVLSALAHTHGLCCLLVEHDLDFVAEVATRIIVLHQGRIVMDGSFREVAESELVRTIYAGNAPAANKTAQATRQASQQATEQAARQGAQPATPPVSPEGAQP